MVDYTSCRIKNLNDLLEMATTISDSQVLEILAGDAYDYQFDNLRRAIVALCKSKKDIGWNVTATPEKILLLLDTIDEGVMAVQSRNDD